MFHGELALDQLFTMRPILGHAGYASPIRGLHLCGAGTHPGGFMTGDSGTAGGTSGNEARFFLYSVIQSAVRSVGSNE